MINVMIFNQSLKKLKKKPFIIHRIFQLGTNLVEYQQIIKIQNFHAIWLSFETLTTRPLGMHGKWYEHNFGENCQCEFEATQQKAFIYPTYLS